MDRGAKMSARVRTGANSSQRWTLSFRFWSLYDLFFFIIPEETYSDSLYMLILYINCLGYDNIALGNLHFCHLHSNETLTCFIHTFIHRINNNDKIRLNTLDRYPSLIVIPSQFSSNVLNLTSKNYSSTSETQRLLRLRPNSQRLKLNFNYLFRKNTFIPSHLSWLILRSPDHLVILDVTVLEEIT